MYSFKLGCQEKEGNHKNNKFRQEFTICTVENVAQRYI